MQDLKKIIKRLVPASLLKPLLPIFHWMQAFSAQLVYGFPARNMKVVAITGTNGKTTTLSLLTSIIEASGQKVGVSTTAYYKIGQKMTVNEANMTVVPPFRLAKLLKRMKKAQVDWVLLEVTSHALMQHRILGIPIDTAVMTNLTQDHLDYHGSMERYAAAKGRLFAKKPLCIVLNGDDKWFKFYDEYQARDKKIVYGTNPKFDYRLTKAEMKLTGTDLTMMLGGKKLKAHTHLIGKFNTYNVLAAASTAEALGIKVESIANGIASLQKVSGRMDIIQSEKGFRVIVDYAHTADALQNVLETLRGLTHGRIITVFGATGDRDKSKRPVMGKVVNELSDIAIVTDDDPYTENPLRIREDVLSGMKEKKGSAEVYEIGDRRGAIAKALELARRPDVILLAGLGHQNYRVLADKKEPWNDRQVTEELLAKI